MITTNTKLMKKTIEKLTEKLEALENRVESNAQRQATRNIDNEMAIVKMVDVIGTMGREIVELKNGVN